MKAFINLILSILTTLEIRTEENIGFCDAKCCEPILAPVFQSSSIGSDRVKMGGERESVREGAMWRDVHKEGENLSASAL